MPAFIRFVGAVPGAGFSMKAVTRPSPSVGTTPKRDGIRHRGQRDRRFRRARTVEGEEGGGVEVREHVPVEDEKRIAHAGLLRREPYGARRVERIGLHDVLERHTGDLRGREGLQEGIGAVAEREHGPVDAVLGQPLEHVHDHGPLDHWEHLLGDLVGERPEPGSLAADENDGVHQPAVVVVLLPAVVLVVVPVPAVVLVVVLPPGLVVVVVPPGLVVVVVVPTLTVVGVVATL